MYYKFSVGKWKRPMCSWKDWSLAHVTDNAPIWSRSGKCFQVTISYINYVFFALSIVWPPRCFLNPPSADYVLTIVMKFPKFPTPLLKDASILKFPGQKEGIHIFPNFVKNIQTPIPINVDFPPCKSKKEARPHDVSHNALVAVVVDDDLYQLSHGGHQVFKMLQELGDLQTGTCSLTANSNVTVRTEMQMGSQRSLGVKNQIMVIIIILAFLRRMIPSTMHCTKRWTKMYKDIQWTKWNSFRLYDHQTMEEFTCSNIRINGKPRDKVKPIDTSQRKRDPDCGLVPVG